MACEASITMPVTTMDDFASLCETIQGLANARKVSIVAEFTGRLSTPKEHRPALAPPPPLRIVFSPLPEPATQQPTRALAA